MITVGNSLEQAISSYARNLSIIHQEVSTPSTPGYNNFQVSKDRHSVVLECVYCCRAFLRNWKQSMNYWCKIKMIAKNNFNNFNFSSS